MGEIIESWIWKMKQKDSPPRLTKLVVNNKRIKFAGLLSETLENQLLWLASKSGEYKYHQKLKRWYEANEDRVEHIVAWVDGERMLLQDFVNKSLGMFWRNG